MLPLRTCFVIAVITLVCLSFSPSASAQDRIFNYTYQSLVLSPGQREIEVWSTVRWGREEFYRALDQRLEFEVGLAPRLQTAFYLNIGTHSASSTTTSYTLSGTGQLQAISTPTIASETEWSFSNEWKYKVLDPVADPLGLALYGEVSVGSSEYELEPRLILDKVIGRAVLAFNAAGEIEFEREIEENGEEETEKELGLEFSLAAGFRVADGVHVGVEAMNKNGFHEGSIEYSALFAGPTVSYAQDNFWVNLTVLPQIAALKGATSNGLVLNESERFHTRLLFSYAF